jgi:hypothetical protein
VDVAVARGAEPRRKGAGPITDRRRPATPTLSASRLPRPHPPEQAFPRPTPPHPGGHAELRGGQQACSGATRRTPASTGTIGPLAAGRRSGSSRRKRS